MTSIIYVIAKIKSTSIGEQFSDPDELSLDPDELSLDPDEHELSLVIRGWLWSALRI